MLPKVMLYLESINHICYHIKQDKILFLCCSHTMIRVIFVTDLSRCCDVKALWTRKKYGTNHVFMY